MNGIGLMPKRQGGWTCPDELQRLLVRLVQLRHLPLECDQLGPKPGELLAGGLHHLHLSELQGGLGAALRAPGAKRREKGGRGLGPLSASDAASKSKGKSKSNPPLSPFLSSTAPPPPSLSLASASLSRVR